MMIMQGGRGLAAEVAGPPPHVGEAADVEGDAMEQTQIDQEAAGRMADMKKQDMAEAAEQALVGTGWLPTLMRTPRAAQEPAEHRQADAVTEASSGAYSVAAE